MQLDHVDVLGPEPGLLVDAPRGGAREVRADHLDVPGLERAGKIRRHRLRRDLDGARGEAVLAHEALARHHRGRRAARGRAALEQRQRRELHRRRQHLLER